MVAGNAVTGLEQEGIPCEVDHLSVASPHLTRVQMNTTAGSLLLLRVSTSFKVSQTDQSSKLVNRQDSAIRNPPSSKAISP